MFGACKATSTEVMEPEIQLKLFTKTFCSIHTIDLTGLGTFSLKTLRPPELVFLFMLANDPFTFPIFKENKNSIKMS